MSTFVESGYRRGDYVVFRGMASAVTTSGLASGPPGTTRSRVTRVAPNVLGVRPAHVNARVEWLHRRAEDWLLWPAADAWRWLTEPA